MNILRTISAAALLTAAGLQFSCESNKSTVSSEPVAQKVDLDLETSRSTLTVGDTATITARSKDTYGRDAEVKWVTTGGKLSTEERGRLARVRFDTPGTYTITATLMVDGKEVKRDSVNIEVRPTT